MILVTGATGFIGTQLLLDLLEKQFQVRALKRSTSVIPAELQQLAIEWVNGDVLDVLSLQEAMLGVTKVYHCAAWVSLSNQNREEMYKVNIEGTANVVNTALSSGVKKLVHLSSIAGLGTAKESEQITESCNFSYDQAHSAYGISKYESECEVWRGTAEGLNAVIVNPSIVLANKDWEKGSGRIFGAIKKGLTYYAPGSNGYVDVRDVSRCMIALMESDVVNERFILSADNKSYRELFALVAAAINKKAPTKKLRPWMLKIAWRINWLYSKSTGSEPVITKNSARAAFQKHNYSNQKICQTLNFKFIPIEQSILHIISENRLKQ